MKRILLLLLLCTFTATLFSQTLTIRLTEPNKSPVIGATVRLTDRADTTNILAKITDTTGVARFSVRNGAQYRLEATAIGSIPLSKGVKISGNDQKVTYTLNPDTKALDGVTITARRPIMRQEEDKTIVDPEPIANVSTSAYEIMEKTPGLFVDQDGNVYLNSATPAAIYINGREQRMSASDIAGILKSLPPGSIERLEILRTPSAKYDAANSGGIVNVVLKKGVKIGRTGSVSGGLNQGRFGNRFANLTLNNSDGGRTSNLTFNYSNRNNYDQIITDRILSPDRTLSQTAYTTLPGDAFYTGYSLGFEPSKKWELNLDGRANYNINRSNANNRSTIGLPNEALVADNLNDLHNRTNSFTINQGLQSKYKIDSAGSELTFDMSYNFTDNQGLQDFNIASFVPASEATLGGLGNIDSRRHFFTAQVDWRYKLPKELSIEAGAKTAIQDFENVTDYEAIINGVSRPDIFRTNTFRFKDRIHAAYAQASKTFLGSFVLKAGVRMENTNMDGRQKVPSDTSFRINRTDFFPYVYLSRPLAKLAGFPLRAFLIHRRSITRPGYDLLNPFPRFLDQYLYESGNPALRPQFTSNFEFNISMMDFPILAVGRNYIQDIFTNVVYQDPRIPTVAYRTYDNLGKNEETYLRMLAGMPPGGKFFFVVGAQYNHNRYRGLYENENLEFTRGSWTLFTFQQLRIDKRSTLSLNGFWRLKGQLQFYELGDFGSLSLNVNRMFLDRKLTVTLSVNDVFFTNRNTFTLDQGNITVSGRRQADTRRVGLNVRYNFGMKKREERGDNPFNMENLERSSGAN